MAENVCTSIIGHFSALPDPRTPLKTRHKLVDIVGMALGPVAAEADDSVETSAYAQSNEITAIPELPKLLDLRSSVVTVDTMSSQKEIARQVVEKEADYIFSLKGNQGDPHKEVELLFQDAKNNSFKDLPHDSFTTVDGEHGRIETRRCTTVAGVDWFEEKNNCTKLSTFDMIESEREVDGNIKVETRYFNSSLTCDAKRSATSARGHWAVENGLHWSLDIAFHVDDNRVRSGNAPATLRVFFDSLSDLLSKIPTGRSASTPAESGLPGILSSSISF